MEKTEYLPDTNTLLRYLLDDEPVLAQKARDFWESVREGRIKAKLTEGVLMECVYVLQRFYKVPRQRIAETLSPLLGYKGLDTANKDMYDETLAVYESKALDFVDCLLIAQSRHGQGRIFSFDDKLNRSI